MQRLLRQLQEKFFQVYNVSDSEHDDQDETEEASFSSHTNNMNTEFMETSNYDCSAGFDGGFEKMEKVKEAQRDRLPFGNIAPPMLADGKNLSDTLKHELSRVVNESVDSVLKKFTSVLSSQTSQLQNDQESMSNNMASESKNLRPYAPELAHFEDSVKPRHFEYYQNAEAPADEDQTEALSLVVRKSSLNHPSSASQGLKRPYHLPQTPFQFNYHQAVQENQILEHLLKYGPHGHFSSQPCIPPSMDRSSPELVDIPWEAIKSERHKISMNLSEQNMHSSTESYLVEDKNELSHSSFKRNLYDDSLRLYSNGSIISQLLRKSIQNKRVAEESLFYLPPSAVPSSTTADFSQEDRSSSSSKESTLEPSSPASQPSTTTSFEADGPFNEHRQAKRARVENIIRGMAVFPNARVPADRDRSDPSGDARESYRENKRKQRLPQHQNHSLCEALPATRTSNKDNECHQLKEQLQSMQRLLRQLQEKFFQVYNVSDSEHDDQDETEEASFSSHTNNMNTEFMETSNYDCSAGFDGGFEKMEKVREAQRDRLPFGNIAPPMLADGKNLSDTLKHELSRVVNESVDSVLKKFTSVLSSQTSQLQNDQESMSNNMASESKNLRPYAPELAHFEDSVKPRHFEYYQNAEALADEDQTEALSLVVRKSSLNHPSSASQGLKRPYHLPQTPFQFNYHQAVQENQILEHLLKYGPHGHFSSQPCIPPSMDRSSPELVDIPWEAIKLLKKNREQPIP
ncbi:Prospero homeobox protein 1 [Acipenser ruthenus]|uniref:Prospero homeobox protein 1 n=1 Tax=Acipenser ruthenus TaxID=7906 RepID=A0A444V0X5_ACIRT|nr:Prospero homeobox protein 1 [Acipenser ruthenus]